MKKIKITLQSFEQKFDQKKYVMVLVPQIKLISQFEQHIKNILELDDYNIQLKFGEYYIPSRQTIKILAQEDIYRCIVKKGEKRKRDKSLSFQINKEQLKNKQTKKTKIVKEVTSSDSSISEQKYKISNLKKNQNQSSIKQNIKKNQKIQKFQVHNKLKTSQQSEIYQKNKEKKIQIPSTIEQPKQTQKKIINKISPLTKNFIKQTKSQISQQKPIKNQIKLNENPIFTQNFNNSIKNQKSKFQKNADKMIIENDSDDDTPEVRPIIKQKNQKEKQIPDSKQIPVQTKPVKLPIKTPIKIGSLLVTDQYIPVSVRKNQFKKNLLLAKQLQQKNVASLFNQQTNNTNNTSNTNNINNINNINNTNNLIQKQKEIKKNVQNIQSNQWIQISSKILQFVRKTQKKSFFEVNDEIQFQISELDEINYTPILSEWKSGRLKQVDSTNENLTLQMMKSQNNKQELKISEFNIWNLKMNQKSINQQKKKLIQLFNNSNSNQNKFAKIEKTNNTNVSKENESTVTVPVKTSNQVSKQNQLMNVVNTQINYYFSDKNYSKDNFLIMHAAKDPQLYIKIALLLNFPKIKRLNIDQFKILQFLKNDVNPKKTYELNQSQLKIRKKGLRIEKYQTPVTHQQKHQSITVQSNLQKDESSKAKIQVL